MSLTNSSTNNSLGVNSIKNAFGTQQSNSLKNYLPTTNTGSTTGSLVNSGKDFLNSNTLISKIVIIIIVIVLFIYLFRLGVYVLNYFLLPSRTPIIIDGMINGNKSYVVEVDPNLNDSTPIYRSDDRNNGIEYTYNSWIFIDNIFYQQDKYQHIWHKGDKNFDNAPQDKPGISYPNNSPGVYIKPNTNVLSILINTYNNLIEEIEIDNIPVSKWICLTLRLQNKSLDVYFNGTLIKRHALSGVPKQNYGKIWCAQEGGFGGYLSKLQYWDYALDYNSILNVVKSGPKLKVIGENTNVTPPYLAMRWYYDEMQSFTDSPFIPN